MARRTDNGCCCRVPIAETVCPAFSSSADALKWLADRGVEVGPDHLGRLSIPVADAQRLWDEQAAQAVSDLERMNELAGAARTASNRLAEINDQAYTAVMQTLGADPGKAHRAAREAVAAALAELPPEVQRRVDLPGWPTLTHP